MNKSQTGEDSTCVGHEACPECGSRDNLARYDDGHAFCFSIGCEYREGRGSSAQPQRERRPLSTELITDGVYADLSKRWISEETCRHFGYTKRKFKGQPVQIANSHDA